MPSETGDGHEYPGSFAAARRTCRVLNAIAVAVSAWAFFRPVRYQLAIALLFIIPWVAVLVVVTSNGMVVISAKRNDQRPSVALGFVLPGLMLALRVLRDMNPLTWERALLLGIAVSGALCFATYMADESLHRQRVLVVLLFVLSLGYGYGVAMETNAIFDHSPGTVFAAKILRKYVSSSTKSTSYHLVIAPWGPRDTADNIIVSRSFYDLQQVGEPVCIALRSGALGINWYAVGSCQQ